MGAAAAGVMAARGADVGAGGAPQFQLARPIREDPPQFPEQLYRLYSDGGAARIEIDIGESGRVEDWLVLEYTSRPFADLAIDAIRGWKFQPALWNGQPISLCQVVDFDFEVKGVVVSTDSSDILRTRWTYFRGRQQAYHPYSLAELDRPPVPIRRQSPLYPKNLASRGVSGVVTIDFYIDEQGRVRMPSVVGQPAPQLANLAMEAVKRWQFEPPTHKGHPVLAHIVQPFNFNPGPAEGSG